MARDQRLSDALLEMRVLARLSPTANGLISYPLGFLSPRIHSTSHPNKEEMDGDDQWQMVDSLNNA